MKKLRISVGGKSYEVTVEVLEDTDGWRAPPAPRGGAALEPPPAPAPTAPAPAPAGEGDVVSPMSATVVSVLVKQGQAVEQGQPLLVLEAMKMESNIQAPGAGTVREVFVRDGEVVAEGQPLVAIA